MPVKKRYYSMNESTSTIKHDLVTVNEALDIIDKRNLNQKDSYESSDLALADTMFGFIDEADKSFIEICLNGAHPTNLRFEYKAGQRNFWLFKWPIIRNYEVDMADLNVVKRLVETFFSLSATQFFDVFVEHGAKETQFLDY